MCDWLMFSCVFAIGAVAGSLLTTCFTHYFLKKYEEEEEPQQIEEINITVPVPEPIVNNSPEFDVWKPF